MSTLRGSVSESDRPQLKGNVTFTLQATQLKSPTKDEETSERYGKEEIDGGGGGGVVDPGRLLDQLLHLLLPQNVQELFHVGARWACPLLTTVNRRLFLISAELIGSASAGWLKGFMRAR